MVDAILCDATIIQGNSFASRAIWANRHFGPTLGVGRVHGRTVAGGRVLYTRTGEHGDMMFATDHPRAGQERYTWVDHGNGVSHGTLKTEAAHA